MSPAASTSKSPELPCGWVRLPDLPDGLCLGRGCVLRAAQAKWPYESVVDFMLVESPGSASGLKLMVSSGHKAGSTKLVFSDESCFDAQQYSLASTWLKANWAKWVYPECPVDQVWFLARYPIPTVPTPGEPTPRLVWNQEPNTDADLYHSLADEFHLDAGQMLDEVLQRHRLPPAQRREIASGFLFRLMDRLDEGAVYQLEDQAFENYPALNTRVGAAVPWRAGLAFLRQVPDRAIRVNHAEDEVLELGALEEVLLSNDTWLHEVCGDPLDAYFDAQAATQADPANEIGQAVDASAQPGATQARPQKGQGDA